MRTGWVVKLMSLWLMGSYALAQKTGPANGLTAGLKGEYFNGPNFEKRVLVRTDPQVNFDWNWQYPGPGVQREYFSVRWTGKLYAPTSGRYRFSATVDDGVRVWVNGKLVIDEWRKQDDSQFVGEIALTEKRLYDLRIEYYNDWKGSVVSVFWQLPDDRLFSFNDPPYQVIPTRYLFSRPVLPASAAVAERKTPVRQTSPGRVAAIGRPAPKPNPPNPTAKPAGRTNTPVAVASKPAVKPTPVLAAVVPTGSGSVAPTAPTPPATESFNNLKTGAAIVLRHVVFAQSQYTLLPESYAELDKLVRALQTNSAFRVEIVGHTDNVGDKRLNQALSENRAKVIAAYLVRHGVAENRITAKGYGDSQPIADNATESQRAQNRRVELLVK